MDFEISERQRVGRAEAAARLRALATALSKDDKVEYARGDLRVAVRVPDEVDFKLELEVDNGEVELEVELKWEEKRRAKKKGGAGSQSRTRRSRGGQ